MTLGSFVVRNTFRNKRRSLLTMISISFSFSLLLLTLMICIWRSFYVDQVAPEASRRVITRDRVSLAFFLPAFYRDKIRSVKGVTAVAPLTWFGGRYIDDRPEHFFAQMATDPDEYLKVASDKIVPPDQLKAWQQDRAGAMVDLTLAKKYGWKIGDHVTLQANIFPVNLDLTIRAIYQRDPPQNSLYFNAKYLEESVPWFKGQAGWYAAQIDSADNVSRVSKRWMTCSATRRCKRRPRARRLFSWALSPRWGTLRHSSWVFAEQLCSPSCWFRLTPWRCQCAAGRVR
jgi:putative ABC transport system permease protein